MQSIKREVSLHFMSTWLWVENRYRNYVFGSTAHEKQEGPSRGRRLFAESPTQSEEVHHTHARSAPPSPGI